nr:MAG TPA: hypothetical protein [Caudoviricetes sp.]
MLHAKSNFKIKKSNNFHIQKLKSKSNDFFFLILAVTQ